MLASLQLQPDQTQPEFEHPQSESHVVLYSPQESGLPLAPADQGESSSPAKRKRRAWAPNADDHLIYRMVKLDGSGQDGASARRCGCGSEGGRGGAAATRRGAVSDASRK